MKAEYLYICGVKSYILFHRETNYQGISFCYSIPLTLLFLLFRENDIFLNIKPWTFSVLVSILFMEAENIYHMGEEKCVCIASLLNLTYQPKSYAELVT